MSFYTFAEWFLFLCVCFLFTIFAVVRKELKALKKEIAGKEQETREIKEGLLRENADLKRKLNRARWGR